MIAGSTSFIILIHSNSTSHSTTKGIQDCEVSMNYEEKLKYQANSQTISQLMKEAEWALERNYYGDAHEYLLDCKHLLQQWIIYVEKKVYR